MIPAGQLLAMPLLIWMALTHSTRLLGMVLFAVALLAALIFLRRRGVVAIVAFTLLFFAELLPFDISLIRGPGHPHLAPYLERMTISNRPIAVKPDGTLEYTDGQIVCGLEMPNRPKYVVVW